LASSSVGLSRLARPSLYLSGHLFRIALNPPTAITIAAASRMNAPYLRSAPSGEVDRQERGHQDDRDHAEQESRRRDEGEPQRRR
jgi:hypothetical protein